MLVIFAGGEVEDYQWLAAQIQGLDYLICADGGTRHARALDLSPNLIIGDMDSISRELLQSYRQAGVKIKHYPQEKDEVDTELAVIEAIRRGAKEILLFGATGGRLDHTLANIHIIIQAAEQGCRLKIVDRYQRLYLITPALPATISGAVGDIISLLPVNGRVTGANSCGLKWELNNHTFTMGSSLGVSNELTAGSAWIKVQQGMLLLVDVYNPPTIK